ncbi:uncharacterized protein LOC126840123, partial [Adelges cooleyi]|uniref:uncharacterized protein LOC126840123 n=1 Tax=Adelges cooleyi TaxID=133065 RepID=UPI00217FCEDB
QLDDIYDAVKEYAIATASLRARFCLIQNRVEMKQKILQDTTSSDAVNFGSIKNPLEMNQKILEDTTSSDAVNFGSFKKPLEMNQKILEDTKASDPLVFGLIEKYEESNHNLLEANQSIDLIFNDFPDIRLPIEEFNEKMNNIKELLNISNLTDEILDEIYSTLREDAANNSIKFYIFEKRTVKEFNVFKRVIGFKSEKIPDAIDMSKEEFNEIMNAKIENLTDEILDEIYSTLREDAANNSIQFYIFEKLIKDPERVIGFKIEKIPDAIDMSKEEFNEIMNAKIENLTDEILDEIYSTLREDAANNSIEFYIFEKLIEDPERVIGFKIEKIPDGIHMSKKELKNIMNAKIENLTDEHLERIFEKIIYRYKGCVDKLSVEGYLCKKTIGSKHILSEQEIEYLTKSLPSVMCLAKSRFKDEIKRDEVLDEIYAGAQRYLAKYLKPLGILSRKKYDKKVDRSHIERFLVDNLSKYNGLTIYRVRDVVNDLPPAKQFMSKSEFKDKFDYGVFTSRG